jgi:hypothetical protein
MSDTAEMHARSHHRLSQCGRSIDHDHGAAAAAGLPVTIGSREFFHPLLNRYPEELGLD